MEHLGCLMRQTAHQAPHGATPLAGTRPRWRSCVSAAVAPAFITLTSHVKARDDSLQCIMDVLARNNVQVLGRADAQPILFVHGFGCDQNMWRFVAPAFERSHRVVLLDLV